MQRQTLFVWLTYLGLCLLLHVVAMHCCEILLNLYQSPWLYIYNSALFIWWLLISYEASLLFYIIFFIFLPYPVNPCKNFSLPYHCSTVKSLQARPQHVMEHLILHLLSKIAASPFRAKCLWLPSASVWLMWWSLLTLSIMPITQ